MTEPRTTAPDLAPQYDPAAIEAAVYQRWEDAGAFAAEVGSDRDPYVIVIPPPNVTSVLHMGHGLNNTLQDVLIRFERMRGREALWIPGTDHAGIATQNVVERQLAAEGQSRHDVGRAAFVARVWQHVETTGPQILGQLKTIGASCDWSRTRFTLDDGYSHAVRRIFVQLHDEGLIYRGLRVIHWCPRCHTALSDEEAEFHDRTGRLTHIRYPVVGRDREVVVATTRPETMFGDVCLVYHPDDDRYAGLTGADVRIPLTDVTIPIATSRRVERDFGTGMLKVTPAHDANDFEIANELDRGFDRPVVIDAEGRMAAVDRVPADLRGLDRDAARTQVLTRLDAIGAVAKSESHDHAVRQCYRCDTVVEPRLSDQWFVRMAPLAEPALQAYHDGQVRFVPEKWGRVYEHWLTNIRDWNISRQLWWGHRIPAWYCEAGACDTITVTESAPAACAGCGGAVRQDEDVLDTWFSSWLWPFATLGWPDRTEDLARFYPGHTLVTGADIIFFWVSRMIMAGYHFMDATPFHTVYLNGIVRDLDGRKMSKSLGNGIDPLDVVSRFGADALRFTVVTDAATGNDVLLDHRDLETSFAVGRNFSNKVWNVARFILAHADGPSVSADDLEDAPLELADRWILARLQHVTTAVTAHFDDLRLDGVADTVYHFFWNELADWYVEQVKPRLYGDTGGGEVARGCLLHVFETTLRLIHPIMPFITEELWGYLPPRADREPQLIRAAWPGANPAWNDPAAVTRFGLAQEVITAVRTARAEYRVPPATAVRAVIDAASTAMREAIDAERGTVMRLAKLDALDFGGADDTVGAHAVLSDGTAVFVPLGDTIDVAAECSRLGDELARLDKGLHAVRGKLSNNGFTTRAPADVVEREREKERSWSEQRDTLAEKRRALGC